MTPSADLCRSRGWVVGDVIVGTSCTGRTVAWVITAIGEELVAKRTVATVIDGEWIRQDADECLGDLGFRDWAKATPEQLAAIRPTSEPDEWTGSENIPRGTFVSDEHEHEHPEVCVRLLGCTTRREAAALLAEGEAASEPERWSLLYGYDDCEQVMGHPVLMRNGEPHRDLVTGAQVHRDTFKAWSEFPVNDRVASVVEQSPPPEPKPSRWVKGDTFLQRGGPFRLTPETAQSIVSELRSWLAAQAPTEDRTEPAPGYVVGLPGSRPWTLSDAHGTLRSTCATRAEAVACSWELHDEEAGR